MKIVVGLGNPGPEYVFSRHNAGWLAIDHIQNRLSCGAPRLQFSSMSWSFFHAGEKVLLLKPLTYMNLSGKAVGEAAEYLNIPWKDVLVIYDDVALPFGKLRMRSSGSAGGHKGMLSILGRAKTAKVPRLRIGVGAAPDSQGIVSWVLGSFCDQERKDLPLLLDRSAEAVESWITVGTDMTMNLVNAPH